MYVLQIFANKRHVLYAYWFEKKNHALMVPIKSTYVFESTNRFIHEYIRIDL